MNPAPAGATELSPALQRWVNVDRNDLSPGGTTELRHEDVQGIDEPGSRV